MKGDIEYRRHFVESAYIRGMTQREITKALEERGFINKRTGKPYSLNSTHKDIKIIRERWREDLSKSRDDRIAEILPRLKALQREGWKNGNHNLVRKVIKDIRDLMGLDAPKRTELDISIKKDFVNAILSILPDDYSKQVRQALGNLLKS
jgi:hypothetical protein